METRIKVESLGIGEERVDVDVCIAEKSICFTATGVVSKKQLNKLRGIFNTDAPSVVVRELSNFANRKEDVPTLAEFHEALVDFEGFLEWVREHGFGEGPASAELAKRAESLKVLSYIATFAKLGGDIRDL